jgi:lipoprotein NlpD
MPRTNLPLLALRGAAAAVAVSALLACTTTGPSTSPGASTTPAQPKATFIRPAAGDPVIASADGRVVFVGSQLRGYGNMVIVKHNETFLSAYAHNQSIMVKENQIVRQGQKIAEMGRSDSDRVKLHFEIRKNGTAVDPEPYLSGKLR